MSCEHSESMNFDKLKQELSESLEDALVSILSNENTYNKPAFLCIDVIYSHNREK